MSADLSISIIDTNNREQTLQCLESVFARTQRPSLEVCVVDNACTDGSAQAIQARFPQVKLIRNEKKLGFSTNNNKALKQSSGRYLMILNDDTIVQPGAFETLVAFMDAHPEAGACGARLLNPDGTDQQSADYFLGPVQEALRPVSVWSKSSGDLDPDAPREVDWVVGASMVVRRKVVEQVGLLDPAFDPIYSEETDWCYRIRKKGWKIYLVPAARVIHLGGQTVHRSSREGVLRLYRNKTLFFRKHRGSIAALLFKVCLLLSSMSKMVVWTVLLGLPGRRSQASNELWTHYQICLNVLSL